MISCRVIRAYEEDLVCSLQQQALFHGFIAVCWEQQFAGTCAALTRIQMPRVHKLSCHLRGTDEPQQHVWCCHNFRIRISCSETSRELEPWGNVPATSTERIVTKQVLSTVLVFSVLATRRFSTIYQSGEGFVSRSASVSALLVSSSQTQTKAPVDQLLHRSGCRKGSIAPLFTAAESC